MSRALPRACAPFRDTPPRRVRSPLHVAVCKGQAAAVRLLLARGASVSCKDIWGNSPLDDARRVNARNEIVDALAAAAALDA